MADSINCPVCGKELKDDYRVKHVVCDCCNSDLDAFRILNELEETSGKSSSSSGNYKMACIAAALIALAAIAGLSIFAGKASKMTAERDTLTAEVSTIKDENKALSEEVQKLQTAPQQDGKSFFVYKVRQGDSFWKISSKFYGSGRKASEIAANNGLSTTAVLHVGDELKIY